MLNMIFYELVGSPQCSIARMSCLTDVSYFYISWIHIEGGNAELFYCINVLVLLVHIKGQIHGFVHAKCLQ